MFKSISTTILTGFFTLIPVILTVYLLYWLAVTSEQMMGGALRWVLPEVLYFPGLGTITGLVLVFFVGLLMKAVLVRQLFYFSEQMLYRLPFIRSVYRAIRDLFDFFSPNKEGFGQVVIVNFNDMEIIGFVTQDDTSRLPESFQKPDSQLVYIPMSYMIGGFTLLIPRKNLTPCNMGMDEAMRFALTAGITGKKKPKKADASSDSK